VCLTFLLQQQQQQKKNFKPLKRSVAKKLKAAFCWRYSLAE